MQNLSCVAGSACLGPDVVIAWSIRSCPGTARLLALPGKEPIPVLCFHPHPPAARSCLGQPPYSEYAERGGVGAVVKAVLQGVRWLWRSGRLLLTAGLGTLGSPAGVTEAEISFLGCSGTPSCEYRQ